MLDTAGDYIAEARYLLQDEQALVYRYPDSAFIQAINLGLIEARRYRYDLFIATKGVPPQVTAKADAIAFELQYRPALLNYVVGHVGVSDAEPSQDARAVSFQQSFRAALTGQG